MNKTFIQVGLPKTASTYLQEQIYPSIPGVFYLGRPYTQENAAFNSLQYADESIYESALLEKEFQLINKGAGGKPVLISDELFSGHAFWGFTNRGFIADRLARVVPHAEIILFLRNQVDLIHSLYNQYVKIGWYEKPLDEEFIHGPGAGFDLTRWMAGERGWNYRRRRFNHRAKFSVEVFRYGKLLSIYKTLFSKVHLFLYEDLKEEPLEQLERLARILQRPVSSASAEEESTNPGLDEEDLNRKLLENKILDLLDPSDFSLRQQVIRSMARVRKDQSNLERRDYIQSLLEDSGVFEDNKQLMESYPDLSGSFSRHYLGCGPTDLGDCVRYDD